MIKLNKIISFLEKLFPISDSEKWDKIGLHYGSRDQKIKKILVSLDLTLDVYEHGLKNKVDIIIIHHPFRWEETLEEDILKSPYKLKIHNRLLNSGIAVYVLHTNYDVSQHGTSYQIAKKIGFQDVYSINESKYASIIKFNNDIKSLKKLLEKKCQTESKIQLNFSKDKKIDEVAILGGSGNIEEILKLNQKEIKTIITSDIKWSNLITMEHEEMNLITVPHAIENVFIEDIIKILEANFKKNDIKIIK